MDIEMEETAEEEGVEGNNNKSPTDRASQRDGEQGISSVNVAVSHAGLAENLRPLTGTKVNVCLQAHGVAGGPRKTSDKALKDLTNKPDNRPPMAKASRPITKVSGATQKENVKILKRAEQALRSEGIGLTAAGPPH